MNEAATHPLWSDPETRKRLLEELAELGRPDEIKRVFAGFQRYLYQREPGTA